MNIKLNTSLIAGILAVVCGLSATALKWGYSGPYGAAFPRYGSDISEGGAIGVTCLLLLLYLIATSPLDPPPVWRPAGIAICATVGGGFFLSYGYGPGRTWMDYAGPWICILSLLLLLLIATVELRGVFIRLQNARRPESQS